MKKLLALLLLVSTAAADQTSVGPGWFVTANSNLSSSTGNIVLSNNTLSVFNIALRGVGNAGYTSSQGFIGGAGHLAYGLDGIYAYKLYGPGSGSTTPVLDFTNAASPVARGAWSWGGGSSVSADAAVFNTATITNLIHTGVLTASSNVIATAFWISGTTVNSRITTETNVPPGNPNTVLNFLAGYSGAGSSSNIIIAGAASVNTNPVAALNAIYTNTYPRRMHLYPRIRAIVADGQRAEVMLYTYHQYGGAIGVRYALGVGGLVAGTFTNEITPTIVVPANVKYWVTNMSVGATVTLLDSKGLYD